MSGSSGDGDGSYPRELLSVPVLLILSLPLSPLALPLLHSPSLSEECTCQCFLPFLT